MKAQLAKVLAALKRAWAGEAKRRPYRHRPAVEALEARDVPARATAIWWPHDAGNSWNDVNNWSVSPNQYIVPNHYPGANANADGDVALFTSTSKATCVVSSTPPSKVILEVDRAYNGGYSTGPDSGSIIQLNGDLNVTSVDLGHSYLEADNAGDNAIDLNPAAGKHGNLNVSDTVGMDWKGTDILGTAKEGSGGSLVIHDKATVNTNTSHDMKFGGVSITVGDNDWLPGPPPFSNWAYFNVGTHGAGCGQQGGNCGMTGNILMQGYSPSGGTDNAWGKVFNTSSGWTVLQNDNDNAATNGGNFKFNDGGTSRTIYLMTNFSGHLERAGTGLVYFDGKIRN
jgi:hypothetical protein